ncbi:uncharacterized protein LOC143267418 [Peromyscus maniculatus bairdii]|uniref:uncharacterized protein LOC143267418 n=1 Tax=Peromyscus maniculatus bairdii TaxID=230844 RepID=UPI003FD26185
MTTSLPLSSPQFGREQRVGRAQTPPDLLYLLGKEGFPPPVSPHSATPAASPSRLPIPVLQRHCAPGFSSARAARGDCALQRSRASAGIRACSASRPRLHPWRGERPVRGVGGGVSLAGCGRGLRGCREGRGAAGQAGKSHTRSGSGDAPAAPLLLLYLAADSGPRICIFWHPVEKGRRTEPAAFKGTAQTVASPREAVGGGREKISLELWPLAGEPGNWGGTGRPGYPQSFGCASLALPAARERGGWRVAVGGAGCLGGFLPSAWTYGKILSPGTSGRSKIDCSAHVSPREAEISPRGCWEGSGRPSVALLN